MSVEAINAVDFLAPSHEIKMGANAVPGSDFAAWISDGLAGVNKQINESDVQLRQLAAGEVDNLHQVMISLEEAKLSFQLALQVRNRLLEAYQDVLRMQV